MPSADGDGDETTTTDTDTDEGLPSVASLSVSDFILSSVAGNHRKVHRRTGTQYVTVRLDSSLSTSQIRERLTLTTDDRSVSAAARQPAPWLDDTKDVAFALGKDETIDSGRVLYDRTEIHALSTDALDRVNAPPVFEVSDVSASPDEVSVDGPYEVTVSFTLVNVGEGRGTFGASTKGNVFSGFRTVTETLDAGATRDASTRIEINPGGDSVTVELDRGSDEWRADIPVVSTPTPSETPT